MCHLPPGPDQDKVAASCIPCDDNNIPLHRLQIQGELASGGGQGQYRGMIRTALGIVKEEVGAN